MDTSGFFHLSSSSKKKGEEVSEDRLEMSDNGWTLHIPPINIISDLEMVVRELRNWHKLMHPAISQEERDAVLRAFEDGLQFHLVQDRLDTSDSGLKFLLTAGLSRRYLVTSTEVLRKIDSYTGIES